MKLGRFNTEPSDHYKSVVRHIQTLSLTEQSQAFADAHADGLKGAVGNWLGRPVGGIRSWRRLFGHKPDIDLGLPGDDHVELWSSDEGMAYVSHPYHLNVDTIQKMVEFAEENGLEFTVSGKSWYYPGETLTVIWRRKKQPH